jgi:hypothetical protein
VLGSTARTAPTQRDSHIRSINEHGRMNWQKTSGYNRRSNVEAVIGRYKRVIGAHRVHVKMHVAGVRSKSRSRRLTECWNSDVQSACASPNSHRTGQSSLTSIHATKRGMTKVGRRKARLARSVYVVRPMALLTNRLTGIHRGVRLIPRSHHRRHRDRGGGKCRSMTRCRFRRDLRP